jgi:FixJ family two-component response regulator
MGTDEAVYLIDSDPISSGFIQSVLSENGYAVQRFASSGAFMDDLSIAEVGCVIANLSSSAEQSYAIQKELVWRGSDLTIISIASETVSIPNYRTSRHATIVLLEIPFTNEQLLTKVREGIAKSQQRYANRCRRENFQRLLAQLTDSERSVLACLMKGLSHKIISSRLSISPRSVDRRRKSILEKMNVATLQELIALLAEAQLEDGFNLT